MKRKREIESIIERIREKAPRERIKALTRALNERADYETYMSPDERNSLTAALMRCSASELEALCSEAAAYHEWQDKTEWVQKTAQPSEMGMHRADVLRQRIEALEADAKRLDWLDRNGGSFRCAHDARLALLAWNKYQMGGRTLREVVDAAMKEAT